MHYLPPASVLPHPVQTKQPIAGEIRRIGRWKDRKQKRRQWRQEDIRNNTTQPSTESVKFLPFSLSPTPRPCWLDKGSSLHQRSPRISHLFHSKGRALAQSSDQARKSSFLLFISQMRDDPRLSAMPVCPHMPSKPINISLHTSLGCIQRDRRRAGDTTAPVSQPLMAEQPSDKTGVKIQWWQSSPWHNSIWAIGLVRLSPHYWTSKARDEKNG